MNRSFLFALISLLSMTHAQAQINKNRKILTTNRSEHKAPKIDGLLNDKAWDGAQIATDFVMLRPVNGQAAANNQKTEVKLIYDDEAVYISAVMYEEDPSNIAMEFTNRDNIGQTDFFLVTINPNDDGQNPFEFIVMSTGSQADAKISNGREDFNWSAVWESAVTLNDKGWVAEMKIPYRALRFANREVQSWGFNFHRKVTHNNSQYTWNFISNQEGVWTQYDGLVEGFRDIQPPTRLSFFPYASTTVINYDGNTNYSNSLGLDIKYGITENFTLDATLIPDFGQTAFDNVVLNLGPFEQQFNEQRQFFTEGTELFGKGNLFYSRRIGDRASISRGRLQSTLNANEEILDYPSKVQMLNAIKVSGRTKNGLGIGFFNAFTEKASATVRNTNKDLKTLKTVEPFTNYSVLVLDQQFNQNSAVTLINTNVTRVGDEFRDGNVTGLLYHVRTKDSKYFIDGSVKMSSISDSSPSTTGYSFDTSVAKAAGNWQGEIGYTFMDNKFDINDLGFQNRNNSQTIYGELSHRILKPTKNFNEIRYTFKARVNYLHNPGTYTGNSLSFSWFFQTVERFGFGGSINSNIGTQYDYFAAFQPVEANRVFNQPGTISLNPWVSSDYRNKFAYDIRANKSWFLNNPKDSYGYLISPRYRFSKQFTLVYSYEYSKTNNDQGYVDKVGNDIIFGQRDRRSYNNSLTGKYNFSIESALSLTFRHYWETAEYQNQYYKLQNNGDLGVVNYVGTSDVNFNSWNFDLSYIWQFAPGSQLIALYRNTIQPSTTFAAADLSFSDNLNVLLQEKSQNLISLRLVYFIDYNKIKSIF